MPVILTNTTSTIKLVTSAAANIEFSCDAIDLTGTPQVANPVNIPNAQITTATTTTVVSAPAASTHRKIKNQSYRNDHASVSCIVEILKFDGTSDSSLSKATLLPGEVLKEMEDGEWVHYDANMTPYFQATVLTSRNSISANLTPPVTSTYLTGSQLNVPSGGLKLGTTFYWRVFVAKTAAGAVAPIWVIRIGTLGTTADAAIITHTGSAQTAAADFGFFDIFAKVQGPLGASCLLHSHYFMHHNLATTGLASVQQQHLHSTSAGFNSATTGLIIGLSITTGTSAVWTIHHLEVIAEGL
jgi:hypothetical protein